MAEPTTGVRFGGTLRDGSGSLITSGVTANTYAVNTTTPAIGTEDTSFTTTGQFDIDDSGFGRFDLKLLNGTDQIWWSSRAEVQLTSLQTRNPVATTAGLEVFSTENTNSSLVAVFGFRPSTEHATTFVETAQEPSDNDEAYINFELSNDNGTPQQWIAGKFTWVGLDVSDGSEDGRLEWDVMTAGSLATEMTLTGALLDLQSNAITTTGLVSAGSLTVTGTTTLNGNLVLGDAAADTLALNATITGGTPLVFEGANTGGDNAHETSFAITDPTADRTITFPDTTLTVNAAADISGTTLASNVVTSSLTTVGVLNAGSINTSFGTINNNAAITGTAVTGTSIVGGTVAGTTGTFSGVLDVTDATDASDATGDTGALRTEGGASIAKKLYVGGDTTITGGLTVSGTTTTVDSTTLTVVDPLIALASGNNSSDVLDIGIYGLYDTSGAQDEYGGLFRDASDEKWKLFQDNQAAPTTTVNTSGTGYAVGTLVATLEGNVTGNVTGNASGTAATVTGGTQASITTVANVVEVGALDAGSITSNFGTINTGSSTITTTGAVATGAMTATGTIAVSNANGGAILNEVSENDNPTINPRRSDADTGLGAYSGGNQLNLIIDGVSTLGIVGGTSGFLLGRVGTAGETDLGSGDHHWGNLHLATGKKIDFAASDVTLTHASNALTLAGGIFTVSGTTGSTSVSSGALVVGGGVGVGENLYVGGAINVAGAVDIQGGYANGGGAPYDGVVDAGGGGNWTTIQAGDDALDAGDYTMLVKSGTYGAALTVATNDAYIYIEPGTQITGNIILSGIGVRLVCGPNVDISGTVTISGADSSMHMGGASSVSGLVTSSGVGSSFTSNNGCLFSAGVLMSGHQSYFDGGGLDTLCSGAAATHGINTTGANDAHVSNASASTTAGGGNAYQGVLLAGNRGIATNIRVLSSDDDGFRFTGEGCTAISCSVAGSDAHGFYASSAKARLVNCEARAAAGIGYLFGATGDNGLMTGCSEEGSVGAGAQIHSAGEDCCIVGNRIDGAVNDLSGTSTVASNEVTAY